MRGEPGYSFHVSRVARTRFDFSGELFSTTGNVIFLDLHAARLFTGKINSTRVREGGGGLEGALRAGDMNAMGLIDEILHYVTRQYSKSVDPSVLTKALSFLDDRFGRETMDAALVGFVDRFPPKDLFASGAPAEEHLRGSTAGTPNREIALEEALHLWLANTNPAFEGFKELFDDSDLCRKTRYPQIVAAIGEFFATQPTFGPDNQDLITMLRSPVEASPHSLSGQLDYIRRRWGSLLGDLLLRLLSGIDFIAEEQKLRFAGFAPGPPEVLEYAGQAAEPEAFSADADWMARCVMMAKNALVWLAQLARGYGRQVSRLDQVPEEELDRLARSGFTALWLIGVWERSPASREIKRRMGNPEAEASAYSLHDYQVAHALGGEEALADLSARARARGIRLASDMVPNHTGIDSRWIMEHPERFLAYPRPYPPYPSYTFGGPNLSGDPRAGVYLEDHYWNRTDAAVVFRQVDFQTGEQRFIYHGNDGTHMPWNDTAQLDFLRPDTREAVIQSILGVARRFPIIRFDAAMTLAKKHFQRLWFPEPGKGGDIPSRAEAALSRHEFDQRMPSEFWRDVVDRVAREAPGTLLLAEAFWLLEGFFVRTLGMHRVYNSAFMNMLKAEDNGGYRLTMRNTLEFDPEVLKRFVNFMSNPDEDTAVAQFGTGDKYFGVCVLLATLPGLPMFAHGQIEGFREKYGMEFSRSYHEETPDPGLAARHEREIFPLLSRRELFSGVESFLLYDFESPEGWVNEDVFAYSNGRGSERVLVLYNNRYAKAQGRIRWSVSFAVKSGGEKRLEKRSLAQGLGLLPGEAGFITFRDQITGLRYIRRCSEIRSDGLYADLGAYQYHVFTEMSARQDSSDGRWTRLCDELAGRGVPSLDELLREMDLRPVRNPFKALAGKEMAEGLAEASESADPRTRADFVARALEAYGGFLDAAAQMAGRVDRGINQHACADAFGSLASRLASLGGVEARSRPVLWLWALLSPLCLDSATPDSHCAASSWIDEWMLAPILRDFLIQAGWDSESADRSGALLRVLMDNREAGITQKRVARVLAKEDAQRFLRVNLFEGARWFHKESLDALISALHYTWMIGGVAPKKAPAARAATSLRAVKKIQKLAEQSGYRWEEFLGLL